MYIERACQFYYNSFNKPRNALFLELFHRCDCRVDQFFGIAEVGTSANRTACHAWFTLLKRSMYSFTTDSSFCSNSNIAFVSLLCIAVYKSFLKDPKALSAAVNF